MNFDDGEYSGQIYIHQLSILASLISGLMMCMVVKVSSARKNSPSAQSNEDEFELAAAFLPYRLLTSAANDIVAPTTAPVSAAPLEEKDRESSALASAAMSLHPYVLSPAIMCLWGYPMHPNDFNRTPDDQGSRKKTLKRKLEGSNEALAVGPIIGLKKGSLPSVGQGFMSSSMSIPIIFLKPHTYKRS